MFLGAPAMLRRQSHMSIYLFGSLKPWPQKIIRILIEFASGVFYVVILWKHRPHGSERDDDDAVAGIARQFRRGRGSGRERLPNRAHPDPRVRSCPIERSLWQEEEEA